jgi:hypothetical protein
MLGESLVVMIIARSEYEIVLKNSIQFFFSFFQDLGKVSKIYKKLFYPSF